MLELAVADGGDDDDDDDEVLPLSCPSVSLLFTSVPPSASRQRLAGSVLVGCILPVL